MDWPGFELRHPWWEVSNWLPEPWCGCIEHRYCLCTNLTKYWFWINLETMFGRSHVMCSCLSHESDSIMGNPYINGTHYSWGKHFWVLGFCICAVKVFVLLECAVKSLGDWCLMLQEHVGLIFGGLMFCDSWKVRLPNSLKTSNTSLLVIWCHIPGEWRPQMIICSKGNILCSRMCI